MIKNAFALRLTAAQEVEALNAALARCAFQPLGGLSAESAGFVPYEDGLRLIHEAAGILAGRVRIDKKIVPASTVKQKVKERCAYIENQQGYKPGRKQVKEIKEQVLESILPTALASTTFINFYFYEDILVIATSGSAAADRVVGLLAKCLEPFPITTLNTARSPAAGMTEWLIGDEAPAGFTLGQMAEMKAADESRASVRWQRETIDTERAQEHFRQGKSVIKLALNFEDKVDFTLNDKGVITQIAMLDVLKESREEAAGDAGDVDADLALYGTTVHELITALINALGGVKAD